MQMWEYMGKLILDSELLKRMKEFGLNDKAVFDAVNGAFDPATKNGGYHMSRAEISDIAGLLGRSERRRLPQLDAPRPDLPPQNGARHHPAGHSSSPRRLSRSAVGNAARTSSSVRRFRATPRPWLPSSGFTTHG